MMRSSRRRFPSISGPSSALKKSPLALDLYAWATYKTYSVNRSGKEGQTVPWRSLQKQLGCDYSNPRHFKAAAKIAVRKVQAVFPGFHVEEYVRRIWRRADRQTGYSQPLRGEKTQFRS